MDSSSGSHEWTLAWTSHGNGNMVTTTHMPSSEALSAVLLFTTPQSLLEEEVPGVQDARKLQLTAGRLR